MTLYQVYYFFHDMKEINITLRLYFKISTNLRLKLINPILLIFIVRFDTLYKFDL